MADKMKNMFFFIYCILKDDINIANKKNRWPKNL